MWQVDLHKEQKKKKKTFLLLCPLNRLPILVAVGDFINLIKSFYFLLFPPPQILCPTMQREMSHFNESTMKSKLGCYFLPCVVLCIFSSLCCLNERNVDDDTPNAIVPVDSRNHRLWRCWDLCHIPSSSLFPAIGACMLFLCISSHYTRAAFQRMLSSASVEPHTHETNSRYQIWE